MTKHENSMVIPKIDTYGGSRIQLTTEAVMGLVDQANGDRAIRSILEHDAHYLPIGKIAEVSIEEKEDHFVVLTTIDDTHEARRFHRPDTNVEMVEVTFTNDSRPFVRDGASDGSGAIEVKTDLANFQNASRYHEFVGEVENQSDLADHAGLTVRRSLTPEPLIQFFINDPLLAAVLTWAFWRGQKFLTYTIDQTLRKTGDEISDVLSRRIRNVIKNFDQYRSEDDRAVTSHVVVKGDVEVHLLTRSPNLEGNSDMGLASLCKQIEAHKDLLDSAESITLARRAEEEEWQMLYIETESGTVISTSDCYDTTSAAYETHQRSFPICICLKHKESGEELHYKTSAMFVEVNDDGHFRMKFNGYPADAEDWDIIEVVVEVGGTPHPVDG